MPSSPQNHDRYRYHRNNRLCVSSLGVVSISRTLMIPGHSKILRAYRHLLNDVLQKQKFPNKIQRMVTIIGEFAQLGNKCLHLPHTILFAILKEICLKSYLNHFMLKILITFEYERKRRPPQCGRSSSGSLQACRACTCTAPHEAHAVHTTCMCRVGCTDG